MDSITDKRVEKLFGIISDYLNSLNSINETFLSNFELLKKTENNAKESLKDFIIQHEIGELDKISPLQAREIKKRIKKVERAGLATVIFPESLLVSLVSQYDDLIGQLIQFICTINPGALNDSESKISYKELFEFNDVESIKERIIQNKVETILRKSHDEQLNDLQNLSGVRTLKKISFWSEFIEITQRRNLFVHCKGKVSDQYIQKCRESGINLLPNIGDKLIVDVKYFNRAYIVFYVIGVLLSQVISRHLLEKSKVLGEIDAILTHIIYETIEEEKYNLAIELSTFALAETTKHSCRLDEVYFVLNYAQAYKWLGNQEKCDEVLSTFDFSAMTSDILVAKYALEDNIHKVVEHMRKVGNNSRIMTREAYVSWAIFKEVREKEEFKVAYKNIFGDDLTTELLTPEENKVVEGLDTNS